MVERLMETADKPHGNQASLYMASIPHEDLFELAIRHLHPEELKFVHSLRFERRVRSYLAGRYAAKKAISLYAGDSELNRIWIDQGIFSQPVVAGPCRVQVSITHCEEVAAAVAFTEKLPMGIDIEQIRSDRLDVLESQATLREMDMVRSLPYPKESLLALLWSAKEALSKALRTGLTAPFRIYELNRLESRDGFWVSAFENFFQYETVSVFFHSYVCSVTYPKGVKVNVDELKRGLQVPV